MPKQVESAIRVVRQVIRCFIYARISEDREGAHLATERQTDDCRELAERLSTPAVEYRVVQVFEDNDLSAYSGKPRPRYQAMLEALRNNEADCVLAWHTDRLHRSPTELERYIDVCAPAAIPTRTVKAGDLDLSTATGRMIARQLGVQARYEVERMIERSKRARDQKATHGEYAGGPRPFGYEDDGQTPNTQVSLYDYGDVQIVQEVRGLDTAKYPRLRAPRPQGLHRPPAVRRLRGGRPVQPGPRLPGMRGERHPRRRAALRPLRHRGRVRGRLRGRTHPRRSRQRPRGRVAQRTCDSHGRGRRHNEPRSRPSRAEPAGHPAPAAERRTLAAPG